MSQVQWFPGHMAKALRLIEENLKRVDFVIECRDARAPHSTRNPVLDQTLIEKKRLIVLTKRDLADEEITKVWQKRLENEGHTVLVVDVLRDPLKRLMIEKTAVVMQEKWQRDASRGIKRRPARALIVGVPNVGKSSIINKLASRKVANVENRPGVTQALQKVNVTQDLEIIDTPGVLWPKFETQTMGIHCVLVGSVKETGFPLGVVTDYARDVYLERKVSDLENYYHYQQGDVANFFEDLGRLRSILTKGGHVDLEKTRQLFLQDIQNGRIGTITWDL